MKVEFSAVGLSRLREKRGLPQRQVANDLGIGQNYIPAVNGEHSPSRSKLARQLVRYIG